jgi:hypothetical protein
MFRTILSDIEEYSIVSGNFPENVNIPIEQEDWTTCILAGNYKSNKSLTIEDIQSEASNISESQHCFLYSENYYFFHIKEFIPLDIFGSTNDLVIEYMALISMPKDTVTLLQNIKRKSQIYGFLYQNLTYKDLFINRNGIYSINYILSESKNRKINPKTWKFDVNIQTFISNPTTFRNWA